MKMKVIAGLVLSGLGMSMAHAGELKVANSDMTLAGGIGAAGIYSDNIFDSDGTKTHSGNTSDPVVTDFLLELSASADKGVGFTAGYGQLMMPSLVSNIENAAPTSSLQYGWVTVQPMKGLTFDAGKLATKIGYEVANTFANPHIMLGGVWYSQPVYYAGGRVSYAIGETTVFAEINENALSGAGTGYVAGASGSAAGLSYSVAYATANDKHDILDLIVSGEVAGIPVAANLDYHSYGNAAPGVDDSGYGLALYATPLTGKFSLPVRIEYMNDGTSGAYGGVDTATSYTVTPTYNFTDNTFVRAEVAYVQADNKIFKDKDNVATDSRTTVAVQAGYKF